MNTLIRAGFSRLCKDKTFLLCFISMFLCGSLFSLKTDSSLPMNAVFFSYAVFIGIPASIFCGLSTGTEYSYGTLRNKLAIGHKGSTIYASTYIVNSITCFIIAFGYILATLVFGMTRLEHFQIDILHLCFYIASSLMMICALSSIFTFICLLISNKANAVVICLLLSFGLLYIGIQINSQLGVMENIPHFVPTTKYMLYSILYDVCLLRKECKYQCNPIPCLGSILYTPYYGL